MNACYIVGPMDVIFVVLAEFAERVERDTWCQLVPENFKFYSMDSTTWEDINNRELIPEGLKHMQEGIFVNNAGDVLRGLEVFNVPVGDPDYVATILRTKAKQVGITTSNYVTDLADEHPQDMWTMLRYCLQHMVIYCVRTCTLTNTEEVASLVDACILEAVEAATRIDSDVQVMANERLRMPTRMKGGGIKKKTDMRRKAFRGALLNILPVCMGIT